MSSTSACPVEARSGRPRARRAVAVAAVLALIISGLFAAAGPATAHTTTSSSGTSCAPHRMGGAARLFAHSRVASIMRPTVVGCSAPKPVAGDPHNSGGSPPLVYHGGKVMSVPSVGNKVVVTPIFWAPSGYSFDPAYESLIVQYLNDVAAASGTDNIYATNTEYNGSNGNIHYGFTVGATIIDNSAFPTQQCTTDVGPVYSDNSGYTYCLDDDQIQAETQNVITAHSLTTNLGHMYVMFTPKAVESCFYSNTEAISHGGNACTISGNAATAAYCAYHSSFASNANAIYAEMPFPIYNSTIPYSCTDESLGGGIQSPNGNTDGDVEVSPLSHEMSEAITDPNGNAWYDANGFENGDDCAYLYGHLSGTAGKHYNQTMNGHHYLTQEEFSNANYFLTGGGCLQKEPAPTVGSISPKSGTHNGGTVVTITGKYLIRGATVLFGNVPGTHITYVSAKKLTVRAPSHAKGTVNVFVQTLGGKSAAVTADRYTFT